MTFDARSDDGEREAEGAAPDALLAVFVGANWERHYRGSFAALRGNPSPLRGSWNWAAALVPFWLASRGLWLLQVFFPLVWLTLMGALLEAGLPSTLSAALALLPVAAAKGYWADRGLLVGAQRAIRGLGADELLDPKVAKRLARQGNPSLFRALVIPVCIGLPYWALANAYVATYSNVPFFTPEFGSADAEATGALVARLPVVQPEAGTAPTRVEEAWIEQDQRVRPAYLFFRRVDRLDRWFLVLREAADARAAGTGQPRVEPRLNGLEPMSTCGSGVPCILWIDVRPPFPDTAHLTFCEQPRRSSRSATTPTSAWPPCAAAQPAR